MNDSQTTSLYRVSIYTPLTCVHNSGLLLFLTSLMIPAPLCLELVNSLQAGKFMSLSLVLAAMRSSRCSAKSASNRRRSTFSRRRWRSVSRVCAKLHRGEGGGGGGGELPSIALFRPVKTTLKSSYCTTVFKVHHRISRRRSVYRSIRLLRLIGNSPDHASSSPISLAILTFDSDVEIHEAISSYRHSSSSPYFSHNQTYSEKLRSVFYLEWS